MMPTARERPEPPPLYAIADLSALAPRPIPEAVAEMAEAGISWIQIRAKDLAGAALYRLVEETGRRLEGSGVRLWIDDRADVAALLPVAGLHLGQADLPPGAARVVAGLAGAGLWIGLSTHTARQVRAAAADPEVDLVAVGPVFPTTGKARPDPAVGLEFVAAARRATAKPLVAIGGIAPDNLAGVLAAGADAVAVLGAICRGDVKRNAARLLAAVAEAAASSEPGRRESAG